MVGLAAIIPGDAPWKHEFDRSHDIGRAKRSA